MTAALPCPASDFSREQEQRSRSDGLCSPRNRNVYPLSLSSQNLLHNCYVTQEYLLSEKGESEVRQCGESSSWDAKNPFLSATSQLPSRPPPLRSPLRVSFKPVHVLTERQFWIFIFLNCNQQDFLQCLFEKSRSVRNLQDCSEEIGYGADELW